MGFLTTVGDLALVVLGFSLIIFIHELGHFAAARWAKVRVLAFAMGFGPAVASYRKGMGWRKGSSEKEYQKLVKADGAGASGVGGLGAGSPGANVRTTAGISPTEYRLNMLPLGGYVKMLGQDDSDPSATSDEADSFTRAPVYKRMVIISAGVIMNLITAAVLFVIVFSYGLKTESATIGAVVPGSPAANATSEQTGGTLKGLQAGDTIVWIDGERIEAFKDVSLAVAMSRKGSPIDVTIKRGDGGSERALIFSVLPTVDPGSGMLAIGVEPARTGRLPKVADKKTNEQLAARYAAVGAPGVEPGMELVDAHGKELDAEWLNKAAEASGGAPIDTRWRKLDGTVVDSKIRPRLVLEESTVERGGAEVEVYHLAGLTPVMSVRVVSEDSAAEKAGLKAGDVFARLGETQWPSIDDGLRQIRTPGRKSIAVSVLRNGELVDLGEVPVKDSRIGFEPETTESLSVLTRFPAGKIKGKVRPGPMAGALAEVPPGSRVLRIGERQTPTFRELRAAIQELVAAGQRDISLTVQLPGPKGAEARTVQHVLRLSDEEARAIAALGWESPIPTAFFEPVEVVLKRSNPLSAVGKGLDETRKMVLTTYLTFARLFQGSVKVEHLKGPIGIADVGTRLAGKGFIWLLFFMAAVSVNLAVVNFLPLPIVDGGHFCFLLWEQFTGRPVSAAVQNVAAIIGLALIGAVFLMTTYNDLANLLWR